MKVKNDTGLYYIFHFNPHIMRMFTQMSATKFSIKEPIN